VTTGTLSGSDVDNGAVLSFTIDSAPTGFSLTDAASGAWSFDASSYDSLAEGEELVVVAAYTVTDEHGASASSSLTITMTGTNDGPVGSAAASLANGTEDAAYTVSSADLLQGFGDIDGDTLSVTGLTASHGTITNNGNGTYTIAPPANYHGPITLNYTVSDGHGGSIGGVQSVTLAPVQDLFAEDDSFSGDEDQAISGDVSDNDTTTSGGSLSFALAAGPSHGTLIFNIDGSFVFTPNANYNGSDSFTYTVTDAASNESATRTVQLAIAPVNDAAVITGQASGSVTEDAAVNTATGDLHAADIDNPVDSWTAAFGTTAHGSWTISAAGVWVFTLDNTNAQVQALNAGGSLTDTFSVTTADGTSQLVAVTINGTNEPVGAPNDLIFTVNNAISGNSLPSGAFAQMSVANAVSGATYSYSATSLTATTLSGGVVANFAGDFTVSSAGVVTATGVDLDRIYELTVQVTQGGASYTESFTIVVGTNADDTVQGAPLLGDDIIYAAGNADVVFAGSGNDTVFGQNNDDQIHGGLGNDVIYSGGNNDRIFFDTALDAATNVDRIMDFNGNNDRIVLDDLIFAALSPSGSLNAANFRASAGGNAADADDYILFDTATGQLYYDADGSGAGAKVLFAHIHLPGMAGTLDGSDFIII
jgi:VCBS repeat-containing protein